MGILNVTPDSFSDGGRYLDPGAAVDHGLHLLDSGADWLDVGGESTRPGSAKVPVEEELARVIPVIRGLRRARPDSVLSIDTSKAAVAARAVEEGARVVNDVTALSDPEMGPLCARMEVELVLMHMRGSPGTMQHDTTYEDLVGEVEDFLRDRAEAAMAYGIKREQILVDPGIGFGKAPLRNPDLIAAVPRFAALGYRVVVGASRKQFLSALTGVSSPDDRVAGSIGAALAAAVRGAHVLRVHDVAATRQALTVFQAVERS
ncbi:MAG: dihydropteroate synthase [Deltaproteobacteria bacterium]|nr:dihydropteroate synthase [Deltaproteobacteria bacterium]MBW2253286.1 dihydropteroate synthase [Deltaproteobacteria bacterium]